MVGQPTKILSLSLSLSQQVKWKRKIKSTKDGGAANKYLSLSLIKYNG
jgi:hypothetical protein